MEISKTLFKNLTRCDNFLSLYNMYLNRSAHNVKEINGEILNIKDELNKLPDNLFADELSNKEYEILESMIDPETGEDLTVVDNAQLEAFKDIYTEVERLAIKYAEKVFNIKIKASTNTYEQKRYEFVSNGNKYYTYLDGFNNDNNNIKVFEVKSTTSTKFDKLDLKVTKKMNNKLFGTYRILEKKNGINCYTGRSLIEKGLNESILNDKELKIIDRYSSTGKYIYDLAITRFIIENYYLTTGRKTPKIDYYLIVLNSKYRYDGKCDINGNRIYETNDNGEDLFEIYDMNYFTKIYQQIIENEKKHFEENLSYLKIKKHCYGDCCEYKKTTQCKFFNVCYKPILCDGSILDYTSKSTCFKSLIELTKNKQRKTIKLYDLLNKDIYTMKDAEPYIVKPDQKIELKCYENNETYFDKNYISSALDKISYPIYHLDFESYNCPLPRFKGEKPYSQSLFQYSLHIEKKPGICDLVEDHHEYLAPDHKDHRKDLIIKLIKDIDLSNGGCVMVYNENFEKTRLLEMAQIYPDLEDEILNIRSHVFDLLKVLDGKGTTKLENEPTFNYYNKGLHGSFSIKKVLPLFTNLTYKDLNVKNGTEAILAYGQLDKLSKEEYEKKYLSLRVYCRQDTWAMVKILEGIRAKIKKA